CNDAGVTRFVSEKNTQPTGHHVMTRKNIVGRLNDGLVSLMTSLGEKIGGVGYRRCKCDVVDKGVVALYKK
ncbi:hypothetical protein OFN11_33160, partial [Escherichia coli]|nr:hypothetical protein [Escherichia coli]